MASHEVRIYDVESQLLKPGEIRQARLALNLTHRGLAEMLLLSPKNGDDVVWKWEQGTKRITGPASQFIRLLLAAVGKGPRLTWPVDRNMSAARHYERAGNRQ